MSDLITLTCPTCGGKLEVSPDASSYVCRHCGNEHIIKQKGDNVLVEAFARCPKCGRNDKVAKVSAIVASETHELSGTTVQETSHGDEDGSWYTATRNFPLTGTQRSDLAKRLAPPPAPDPGGDGCVPTVLMSLSILGIGFWLMGMVALVGGSSEEGPLTIVASIFFIGGTTLAIALAPGFLGIRMKKSLERRLEEARASVPRWKQAKKRWQQLYYCARDDGVFIPGEDEFVPIGQMKEYIYKQLAG